MRPTVPRAVAGMQRAPGRGAARSQFFGRGGAAGSSRSPAAAGRGGRMARSDSAVRSRLAGAIRSMMASDDRRQRLMIC
eukprot:392759-Hanusia_phi.AAC.1